MAPDANRHNLDKIIPDVEQDADEAAPDAEQSAEEAVADAEKDVDETMLYSVPAPSYDEEHSSGIDKGYRDDFSRIGRVTSSPEHDADEIEFSRPDEDDRGRRRRVPGEGRSRSGWRALATLIFLLLMVGAIYGAATYGLESWGGKSVPNVLNFTETRARSTLERAGFEVEVHTCIADDGIGLVQEQEPSKGKRVSEGTRVVITVAVSRTVPDVKGLSQQEAEDLLRKAGAKDVQVEAKYAGEPAGTVLGVQPDVGQGFSANNPVVLTVAQAPTVPDVIGKEKVEVEALLKEVGLGLDATYKKSDAPPNTAFEAEPGVGEEAAYGSSVHVYFSETMPSNPLHLIEYFGKSPEGLSTYLPEQGFAYWSGHVNEGGTAEVAYNSESMGGFFLCGRPFSRGFDWDANTGEDILAAGTPFSGIRWEVPGSMMPGNASDLSQNATRELMRRCGLSNVTEGCSQSDVTVPDYVDRNSTNFTCTYGEVNGYSWTVLLANEPAGTRAVVTCAPTSYYRNNFDLEPYGGSICDMIACTDVYQ